MRGALGHRDPVTGETRFFELDHVLPATLAALAHLQRDRGPQTGEQLAEATGTPAWVVNTALMLALEEGDVLPGGPTADGQACWRLSASANVALLLSVPASLWRAR